MVSREWWVLLGDDPKQKFPTGTLWLRQHYWADRSLQDPCRLSSAAPWPHSSTVRGVGWGCVSFTCTSVFYPKGSAIHKYRGYHILLQFILWWKKLWGELQMIFPAVWMHMLGSRLQGAQWYYRVTPHGIAEYCRVASCSPGPLTPPVRYKWSIAWITTYF